MEHQYYQNCQLLFIEKYFKYQLLNGYIYLSAECSDKDGTSSGSCADGFGVCCTCMYFNNHM